MEPKIKVIGVTDTSVRFKVEHYGYDDNTFCSSVEPLGATEVSVENK